MERLLKQKHDALRNRLSKGGGVAVAFSGGTDSALLLAVAADVRGGSALAVRALTPAQPAGPGADPREFCRQRGIALEEFPLEEQDIPGFLRNTPDRCYLCKRHLFERAWAIARSRGFGRLCDGSNADDAREDRPGNRAVAELKVETPLADCGFSKADVRELSRALGLPTAEQPSAPCLYTRFPTGQALQPERLGAIAAAEELLRQEGFDTVRVRAEGTGARIEVRADQVSRLMDGPLFGALEAQLLSLGFTAVAADPRGYRLGGAGQAPDQPQ